MIGKNVSKYLLAASALVISACAPDVSVLNDTQPVPGDAYTKALGEDYKTLANEDNEAAYYPEAEQFAQKGLSATDGFYVAPIDPRMANIHSSDVEEITHAYRLLSELLEQKVPQALPDEAAAAQVNYECWVSMLAAGNTEGAAICRANFMTTVDIIRMALKGEAEVEGAALYMAFFNTLSAHMDKAGLDAMREAAAAIKESGSTKVLVLGYADLTGTKKINLPLSQRRAEAAKKSLVSMGVPASSIMALGQGATNPLVNTKKADRENRRVEVIIR